MENEKKISLWDKAHQIGPVLELAPGFSFDSDSEVKIED